MGNRASIYIQPSKQTIYLQWQGGPGSVEAFIDEAKGRAGFTKEIQPDFVFYLHHAIRDFFDFASEDPKDRNRDQLSLYVEHGEEICDCDNGHYRLDKAGTLTRKCGKYCSAEGPTYTKESNAFVADFYRQLDAVLLTVEWTEKQEVA